MKKIILQMVFSIILINQIQAQSGQIAVQVKMIENKKGVVQMGLYNSEERFPDFEGRMKGVSIKASKSSVSHTFKQIPPGVYAIAVWHDENQNEKLDKNWFGIPTEDYGFSLNKFGNFGPPDFKDVSFKIEKGMTKELVINLK